MTSRWEPIRPRWAGVKAEIDVYFFRVASAMVVAQCLNMFCILTWRCRKSYPSSSPLGDATHARAALNRLTIPRCAGRSGDTRDAPVCPWSVRSAPTGCSGFQLSSVVGVQWLSSVFVSRLAELVRERGHRAARVADVRPAREAISMGVQADLPLGPSDPLACVGIIFGIDSAPNP